MNHVRWTMAKVVQTELNETEYQLLKKVGEKRKIPLKGMVREAIIRYLEEVEVTPEDPIFGPPSSKTGAKDGSIKHDKYLYGE